MERRDKTHQLSDVIVFDDAYFGGSTIGQKRSCGTEKAFVALFLDDCGNPRYLKIQRTENIKKWDVCMHFIEMRVHSLFYNRLIQRKKNIANFGNDYGN